MSVLLRGVSVDCQESKSLNAILFGNPDLSSADTHCKKPVHKI